MEISAKTFMLLPLSEMMFQKIWEIKKSYMKPVLDTYEVTEQELFSLLWKKV